MEPITVGAALDLKKDNVILNKLGELDAFKKPAKPRQPEETKVKVEVRAPKEERDSKPEIKQVSPSNEIRVEKIKQF
jgi:hypothetical protein